MASHEVMPVSLSSRLEAPPAGDPELTVGRVVDVRVFSHPPEPPAPVHVHADRPAVHLDTAVAAAPFVDGVHRESPLSGQEAPNHDVRVGLSRIEPVVM